MSYEDAFKQAVGQMVGKRVAIDDTGSARAFVDAVFEAGGVTPDDFAELLTVDDARMLLLAREVKSTSVSRWGERRTPS